MGSRVAAVEYDSLDRATRVTVDGETILERDYRPDDPDAARQEDRRTGGVLVVAPVSPVFGTMELIVYSRPRATEFGIVAYSPTRRTFEVRPDALAADALLLGSLHARMAPLDGSEPNPAPFGHDKPSSSLFIPPEFRAVNCEVCVSFVFDVDLDVTPAGEYCYTNYTADVDGFCFDALPEDTTILLDQHPWSHSTSFGDGSWAYATTYFGVVSGSHKYTATGRYTMTHYVNCTCSSAFAHGSDSESFNVPGGILSCRPTVKVVSTDIVRDKIVVTMRPFTASGTLVLELLGSPQHQVSSTTTFGGTRTFSFNVNSLPKGKYTGVRATWTVGSATPNNTKAYSFQVLGDYTHSQYNTPTESGCSGSSESAYVIQTPCTFVDTTFKSDFRSQVALNGTGISIHHGTIGREFHCVKAEHNPPEGANGYTFRTGHTVAGSCGSVSNSTVAIPRGHQHLSCDDSIYIVGVGVKTVTDLCPRCGSEQIDNYTTRSACSKDEIGHLRPGKLKTIKL